MFYFEAMEHSCNTLLSACPYSQRLAQLPSELRPPTCAGMASNARQIALLGTANDDVDFASAESLPASSFSAEVLIQRLVALCSLGCTHRCSISALWTTQPPPRPIVVRPRLSQELCLGATRVRPGLVQGRLNTHPWRAAVQASERGLHDILMNFVTNAVKFCQNTAITLEAAFNSAAGELRVCVTDRCGQSDPLCSSKHRCIICSATHRGRGMDAATASTVFDPYTRAASSDGGGTGLGMAIARSTAQAMGGHVGCTSPGMGCGSTCA